MSAKIAALDLLKITVFWNKDYDLIISVDDVTNKTLSRDLNYTADVLMWSKFVKCSISMRELITRTKSYVRRSYRGRLLEGFLAAPILNRVNLSSLSTISSDQWVQWRTWLKLYLFTPRSKVLMKQILKLFVKVKSY